MRNPEIARLGRVRTFFLVLVFVYHATLCATVSVVQVLRENSWKPCPTVDLDGVQGLTRESGCSLSSLRNWPAYVALYESVNNRTKHVKNYFFNRTTPPCVTLREVEQIRNLLFVCVTF